VDLSASTKDSPAPVVVKYRRASVTDMSAHVRVPPTRVRTIWDFDAGDESITKQLGDRVAAVSDDCIGNDEVGRTSGRAFIDNHEGDDTLSWSWDGLRRAQEDDPDISSVCQLLLLSQLKLNWEDVALKSADVKTLWGMWPRLAVRDGLLKDGSRLQTGGHSLVRLSFQKHYGKSFYPLHMEV